MTIKKLLLRMAGTEVKLGELKHHVFIYRIYRPMINQFRAFCAGSIITRTKVLTSANCFLTNRKRLKVPLNEIRVAAAVLHTLVIADDDDLKSENPQQWRYIKRIYSHRFYRFPAYNNAVLIMENPFNFNDKVNKIPYASKNPDFDGVCIGAVIKPSVSWAENKALFAESLQMMTEHDCERTLLKSCKLFYATAYKTRYMFSDMEGSGLICQETGDSEEVDFEQGVLVGVTSLINIGLPTLHHKVGSFHKWITDGACTVIASKLMVFLCCYILC